jgi:putative transposase
MTGHKWEPIPHPIAHAASSGSNQLSNKYSLMGTFGQTEIAVPRARFEGPDGGGVEELIASVYLAGTNTRRVRRALGGPVRRCGRQGHGEPGVAEGEGRLGGLERPLALAIEPDPHHGAVEDQPHDRLLRCNWTVISSGESGTTLVERVFRVPDRGSGNPTPLGGWDRGASKLEWLNGSVQAGQPYLKGRNSHRLLSEFGILCKRYWGQHLWGRGYWAASSGNVTDEVWVEYIKNQTPPEPDDNFNVT